MRRLGRIWGAPVYGDDACRDQRERQRRADGLDALCLSQQQRRKQKAEDRRHEAVYRDARDGVHREQDARERVGYRRDEAHVRDEGGSLRPGGPKSSAQSHAHAGERHATQHELPAAEHHGVMALREDAQKAGHDGAAERREEDESLAVEREARSSSERAEVDECDPSEAQRAA